MSELLIVGILSVHLLAVNLASAGPLFAIWLGRRSTDHPEWCPVRDKIAEKLAWLSVAGLILGMILGGAQLGFAPAANYSQALERLPSRAYWFAALELAFSFVCLVCYAGCWSALRRHRWWHALLAILSSSNLLYHFPPLMSVLGKLASDPNWAKEEMLDRATLLPLMMRSEILALSTHFLLASIAVAGVAVLWLASRELELSDPQTFAPITRRVAGTTFLVTLLQVPVGVWLLTSLPQSDRSALMGGNALSSLAFVGALLLTFLLLQNLLSVAIGTATSSELRRIGWLTATLVLLMTATLTGTRARIVPSTKLDAEERAAAKMKTAVAQYCATAVGSTQSIVRMR